jgi:carboxymethylenebutenolidase
MLAAAPRTQEIHMPERHGAHGSRPGTAPRGLRAIPTLTLFALLIASPALPQALPAGADDARAALDASPRHGEWATVRLGPDSVRAWIVYPERADRAPVVLVIHEIYGLTHWIRAVADQLAAEGFIAVAPDLLTMRDVPWTEAGEPDRQAVVAAIRGLDEDVVHAHLRAVADHATALPAARSTYGVVGFCWGGAAAFAHAARYPDLGAAVVYYGGSPDPEVLANVRAPVLGLYAGDDERVNATIPRARDALDGRRYRVELFEGAGHGFLRQQEGRDGANLDASWWAWPFTAGFLRTHLGH